MSVFVSGADAMVDDGEAALTIAIRGGFSIGSLAGGFVVRGVDAFTSSVRFSVTFGLATGSTLGFWRRSGFGRISAKRLGLTRGRGGITAATFGTSSIAFGSGGRLLQRFNRERGKTIMMVTHDVRAAERGTRALRLDKGRLHDLEGAAS